MKKYKAIFFDLDGTLLPMDMEKFTKVYFGELCKVLAKYGVPAEKLVEAVWAGTKAMVKNDGKCKNADRFWEVFRGLTGIQDESVVDECDAFYSNQFHRARAVTGENPLAVKAVQAAHRDGRTVVLATNPLFPMVGQLSRIGWLGLHQSDFELITSYESDRFCKPYPAYYLDICARLSLDPADCLMIGNDEREDMYAAGLAGMDGYLVTDCLIPCPEHPWSGPRGSFADVLEYLNNL